MLYPAATGLPILADPDYDGADIGIHITSVTSTSLAGSVTGKPGCVCSGNGRQRLVLAVRNADLILSPETIEELRERVREYLQVRLAAADGDHWWQQRVHSGTVEGDRVFRSQHGLMAARVEYTSQCRTQC